LVFYLPLGVSKSQTFKGKSIEAEPKSSLSHIYTLNEAYLLDFDDSGVIDKIGWTNPSISKYAPTDTGWTAQLLPPTANILQQTNSLPVALAPVTLGTAKQVRLISNTYTYLAGC